MTQADLLRDLLELARREELLRGEGLDAFARALRDRAALILDERVRTVEEENAWRREAMEGLQERVRGLEAENAWQRETAAGLAREKDSLAGERQEAIRAHDELLAHHRDVVRQVVRELLGVSSLSLVRTRQARRRLLALAELLRPEAG